jgi:phosphoribosylaminoimidazolecarboxamide formyltransferase/IMP cyclohydrolase
MDERRGGNPAGIVEGIVQRSGGRVNRRALLSVSDKAGIVDFARGLAGLGFELVSTGGTAKALREAGLAVRDVSEITGHPEMMEGRVKTLHPAVHAGLLARRERAEDMRALAAQGYLPIDLVCVNLYPFQRAAARQAPLTEALEQIDVGGPTMLRAAAKNHASVLVVVDPADYARVLEALRSGAPAAELRHELAVRVFAHTAAYDAAIATYLETLRHPSGNGTGVVRAAEDTLLPENVVLALRRVQHLRYGENPDQSAAFYAETGAPAGSLPDMKQLQGKELSFNNLLDIEAAVMTASAWADAGRVACAIIKHTTPCGVALAQRARDAYERALACDPVSAFGGIVGFNAVVDGEVAAKLGEMFLEIVVAPAFTPEAVAGLQRRKHLRLIELPVAAAGENELDWKRVRGGFLGQTRMRLRFDEDAWRVVTRRSPEPAEMEDLRFAWRVAATVKSNAIVLAREARTIGIGAGQMSRVDASRLAVMKAADQKADVRGAALASDAFFPFRDGVDAAAAHGVAAVIQPGGSVRDEEIIAAADQHGMAMVFTGRRVFRH